MTKRSQGLLGVAALLLLCGWLYWLSQESAGASNSRATLGLQAPVVVQETEAPPTRELDPATRVSESLEAEEAVRDPEREPLFRHSLPEQGIFGRVRTGEGEPAVGCRVYVSLPNGRRFVARTDFEGNYAVEFPLSDWTKGEKREEQLRAQTLQALRALKIRDKDRATGRVEAHELIESLREETVLVQVSVANPLGHRAERSVSLDPSSGTRLRVDLKLANHKPFGGVVEGLNGRVAQADVMLFDQDYQLLQTTRTDAQGLFSFSPPDPGGYHMHARKQEAGTASVGGTFLGEGLASVRQTLTLGGDGILRGQVVLQTGEPVEGIELTGVANSLALGAMPRPTWPGASELAEFESSHGLALSHASTDEEGRFWMRAMQPGNFMLFFDGLDEALQPDGIYFTGPLNEHKVLFLARILKVVVSGDEDLVRRTRVHVVEQTPRVGRSDEELRHLARPCVGDQVQFIVDPGSKWLVFTELDGKEGLPRAVSVDGPSHMEYVHLRVYESSRGKRGAGVELPRPQGRGGVEISLLSAKGKRIPALVSLWRMDGESPTRVAHQVLHDGTHPLPWLSPGAYSYWVKPSGDEAQWSLPIESEKAIEVRAEATKRLSLKLVPGGRLRVKLETSALGASVDPAEETMYRLMLRPKDGKQNALPLSFVTGMLAMPRSTLRVGQSVAHESLIPAGDYRLELYEGQEARGKFELTIEAGQWNELVIAPSEPD